MSNSIVPPLISTIRPYELFKPLQVRDAALRASALAVLNSHIRKLAKENRASLLATLPTVLRLSVEWSVCGFLYFDGPMTVVVSAAPAETTI